MHFTLHVSMICELEWYRAYEPFVAHLAFESLSASSLIFFPVCLANDILVIFKNAMIIPKI